MILSKIILQPVSRFIGRVCPFSASGRNFLACFWLRTARRIFRATVWV